MAGDDDVGAVRRLLAGAGLLPAGAAITLAPLTGGVSCDVWRVDADGVPLCVVKRALAQLRVAAEWFAPLERTESEVRWLDHARASVPHLCPAILAHDAAEHIFAMAYLPVDDHPVWKAELFASRVDPAFAAMVGRDLARVHAASAGDAAVAAAFDTGPLFAALRIDPFLRYVAARQQGAVAERLDELADDLAQRRTALVHGDVSPKNILVGPHGPVLLDAECAVYGDPAFDIAFCATHLLLKAVHLPEHGRALRASAGELARAYLDGVDWEPADALSRRAAALTAALLLARIDGKSPAPYLSDEGQRAHIRAAALALLSQPPQELPALIAGWAGQQGSMVG
jgi:aminoglycoside phosphotransferase (APT) family kinase protein